MKWGNYIHRNTRGSEYNMDCQLVTTVNAYYHLTGKIINQYSDEYRRLADLAGCRYGACIDITKVWKELGIWQDKKHLVMLERLRPREFAEANIWHKRYGFHSVGICDTCKKSKAIRVINFKYETTEEGWMFMEDMRHFLTTTVDINDEKWKFRTFKKL